MAATKRNPMTVPKARDAIRATQLMNRLQKHGFGEVDMSSSQVKALEIVLKKIRPDLSAVTMDATDGLKDAIKGIQVIFGTGE